MSESKKKASRLLEIEALLLTHLEGMTQAEIARQVGVNRSTIHRYLPDLQQFMVYLEGERLFIDRSAYLVNVRFTLDEAFAMHLAARLLATCMNRQNPHAAAALRKLSIALEHLAPQISRHLAKTADGINVSGRLNDPRYLGILEDLTTAWAETRSVRLWYSSDKKPEVREYLFQPYFMEPYAAGHSVYCIGRCEPPGRLRTFKIERIERIEILRENYAIPPDFEPYDLLKDTWGIWYTDEDAITVRLRFSPDVAGRVRENRWHASEMITEEDDGSLIWQARIAEPIEMLPWIKGWGADVEVLEPGPLRETLAGEALALARLYGVEDRDTTMPT